MSVSVTMPRLGESVSEGTVTRWLKKEGEHVEADEPLLEVSTDKVDTEIPSPASGVLQSIKVAEDETVEVGAELAVIGEGETDSGADAGGSSTQTDEPAAEEAEPEPEPESEPEEQQPQAEESAPTRHREETAVAAPRQDAQPRQQEEPPQRQPERQPVEAR